MTIDIDTMTEDSWPDRLKNELNGFRKNQPDKPSEYYYEQLEDSLHVLGEEIVKLREKVRELDDK